MTSSKTQISFYDLLMKIINTYQYNSIDLQSWFGTMLLENILKMMLGCDQVWKEVYSFFSQGSHFEYPTHEQHENCDTQKFEHIEIKAHKNSEMNVL